MKNNGLDHNAMYYRGLGNMDYQECADKIKEKRRTFLIYGLIFSFLGFLTFIMILGSEGAGIETGYVVGILFFALLDVVFSYNNVIERLKLRMKELE